MTTEARFCTACRTPAAEFGPGPSGRPDATCRRCGALERHRILALLIQWLGPYIATSRGVLDVAPQRQIQRLL